MKARALLPLFVSLCFMVSLLPGAALAHGPTLRGREIDSRSYAVLDVTGLCRCQDRWFTVGMRPGTVEVTGAIQACDDHYSSNCALNVYLLRSNMSIVKQSHVSCRKSQSKCTHAARMKYSAAHRGVYYVLVRGEGAHNIPYALTLRGPVYKLHCRRYC